MLLSFYFSHKIFFSQETQKTKIRLTRLLIPYIIIPIIYILIFVKFNSKLRINELLVDLYLQYLTGYKLYVQLWFVQILIIFTVFFKILYYLFRLNYFLIIKIILIISYLLQYNETNYNLFFKQRPHIRSVSHIIEMLPIAITGITLAHIQLLQKLKNHRNKSILYSLVILLFIYKYNVFGNFKGFPYSGIKNNIAAICLSIVFTLIPLEKIMNNCILASIKKLTSYTGGIYYFHIIVFKELNNISFLNNNPIFGCFCIYILCYFLCMFGTKIFKNNNLKY